MSGQGGSTKSWTSRVSDARWCRHQPLLQPHGNLTLAFCAWGPTAVRPQRLRWKKWKLMISVAVTYFLMKWRQVTCFRISYHNLFYKSNSTINLFACHFWGHTLMAHHHPEAEQQKRQAFRPRSFRRAWRRCTRWTRRWWAAGASKPTVRPFWAPRAGKSWRKQILGSILVWPENYFFLWSFYKPFWGVWQNYTEEPQNKWFCIVLCCFIDLLVWSPSISIYFI